MKCFSLATAAMIAKSKVDITTAGFILDLKNIRI